MTSRIEMEQKIYNRITAVTSIFSVIAAITSALAAYYLYSMSQTEREFIQRDNATKTILRWQINTSQHAKSGFKCLKYLVHLMDQESLFDSAWNKNEYDLEGQPKQAHLKACLDRENRIEIKELNKILGHRPYQSTSVKVTQDISKFVTGQAIDYLNFTEAVYMEWKYNTSESCIILEQLGVPTSENLRKIVLAQYELYPAISKFLNTYKDTNEVRSEIKNCVTSGII